MDHVSKKRKQFRTIYGMLHENPRIAEKNTAENLDACEKTKYTRLKEAMHRRIIVGQEIGERSYKTLREYMYFAKCEDPELEYLTCCKNPIVIYNAFACGFCDIWVTVQDRDISVSKVKFLENLLKCCTIATHYFPDGYLQYNPYLYKLRTDYCDFIVEQFSQLPTSSTFFKLSAYTILSKPCLSRRVAVAVLDQDR